MYIPKPYAISQQVLRDELPKYDCLEALKDQYIQIFVELGRRVEALDHTQRGPVNSAVMGAMRELPDFEWFNSAMDHYRPQDREFANFIASFNVLTQYAFFDLLRQQEPGEAQRLGVGP
jgi:hypothetical protein